MSDAMRNLGDCVGMAAWAGGVDRKGKPGMSLKETPDYVLHAIVALLGDHRAVKVTRAEITEVRREGKTIALTIDESGAVAPWQRYANAIVNLHKLAIQGFHKADAARLFSALAMYYAKVGGELEKELTPAEMMTVCDELSQSIDPLGVTRAQAVDLISESKKMPVDFIRDPDPFGRVMWRHRCGYVMHCPDRPSGFVPTGCPNCSPGGIYVPSLDPSLDP